MSSSNQSNIEQSLTEIRDALQREDLRGKLEEAAEEVETILLLQKLEQEMYNPETDQGLGDDLLNSLRTTREPLKNGNVDALESAIPGLNQALSREKTAVTQRLSSRIDKDLDKISAMKRLNDRVEKADENRITALRAQLTDCQNLDFISADSIDVKFDEVEREAAAIETEFEELQQKIFGEFYGTPLEESIRNLLDDEALRLDSLSESEIERLRSSNFADCLELVLS